MWQTSGKIPDKDKVQLQSVDGIHEPHGRENRGSQGGDVNTKTQNKAMSEWKRMKVLNDSIIFKL